MKESIATVVFLLTVALRCEVAAVTVQNEDCKDNKQTDYCKLIFQNNLKNCQEAGYSALALNCRVTCNNCTAYMCLNPIPENVLNCTALADKCTDAIFGFFMKKNCPATCGTCPTDNAQLCKDVASAQTCSALKAFCNSAEHYDLMTQQCPSTCNRCPPRGQCEDTIPDCHAYLGYCNNPLYDTLLREKCGKTCNKCTSTATTSSSSTCVDNVRCPLWVARGFCENSGYSQEVKRQYCPKSCKLC